jgi:hypothetical protein
MNTDLFEMFSPVIRAATAPVVRDPRLAMEPDGGDIQIYYAPFEYINPCAKIVLVGITPGPTQMVNANNIARKALQEGVNKENVIRSSKEGGAFSGEPMRGNLIRQLDHWGFHEWLGIESSHELFNKSRHLVQTTSLLRYPVFVRCDDYRGSPDMTKNPLLRKYLINYFVKEMDEMKDALFLPLGPQVQKVLDSLVAEKIIESERIVRGMLHPSGNNTYRINYLISDCRGSVPYATNPVPYDTGRKLFRRRILRAGGN